MDRFPKLNSDQVEDEARFDRQRVARIWRYVAVTTSIWCGFAMYFWASELVQGMQVCLIQGLATGSLLFCRPLFKKIPLRHVAHMFLFICLIGIFTISAAEGGRLRECAYFLPLGIFLAAQLLGVKAAVFWAIVVTTAILIRFTMLPSLMPASSDSMVNSIGFSIAVYFFCHQAESLFRERTAELKRLTSSLRNQNQTNHFLAVTDSLTGLSNRYGLQRVCQQELQKAKTENTELGYLLIDFDKFKDINDTLGHTVGDELLQKIGTRLKETLGEMLGERGTVARLGGDEFCIVIPDVDGPADVQLYANDIHETLCQPYQVGSETLKIGTSIGISLYPSQSTSDAELLTFADTAMYKAKSTGLKYLLYDSSMTDELRKHRQLKNKLEGALERQELYLAYQPQVCFFSGKAIGAEALIRWNSNGQVIPPFQFVPVLEASGLIQEVGKWVIEESCRQLRIWEDQGYTHAVSLNVSPMQFCEDDFVEHIRKTIDHHGITPALLDFEITEGLLVENVEEAIQKLTAIKELGCSISIDDFGTGYSSLAYLKRFPIDRLKIDREFVKDFPERDNGQVASSIVALGQALNLRVLAEGIETPEQFEFLKDHGCEEYQGYICSKPVSPEECERLFLEFDSYQHVKQLKAEGLMAKTNR